jgi:succinylarginine dihydrolase
MTEINFDGLIGPTHSYAGLSFGNVAAMRNEGAVSRPRDAALQGLDKMRLLMELGLPQGVLPPHERPNLALLRAAGFEGSDAAIWSRAWGEAPGLARAAVSASAMWAANAATISPSADCADGRLHATPANLHTMLHRALEHEQTARTLRRILPNEAQFAVHEALPAHAVFGDEGAANHMRLSIGGSGVEIFVFGREAGEAASGFPARQTRLAAEAVARRHGLDPRRTVYLRQSAAAVAAGAFHNDVVAVSHENVVFHHESAFEDIAAAHGAIRAACAGLFEPIFIVAPAEEVSLEDCVSSYLFNAQLTRFPGAARLTLIAPTEARENNRTGAFLRGLAAGGLEIGEARFVEVRESMRNGGGPACLRLRVTVNESEANAVSAGFLLTPALADRLEAWIRSHYRETLSGTDLADPALIGEGRAALDALTRILPLGTDFYPFQRA